MFKEKFQSKEKLYNNGSPSMVPWSPSFQVQGSLFNSPFCSKIKLESLSEIERWIKEWWWDDNGLSLFSQKSPFLSTKPSSFSCTTKEDKEVSYYRVTMVCEKHHGSTVILVRSEIFYSSFLSWAQDLGCLREYSSKQSTAGPNGLKSCKKSPKNHTQA